MSNTYSGPARQVVFYDPTVSGLVYDYVRNYDIYRKDELEFNINTFKLEGSTAPTMLIPSTLSDLEFSASYFPDGQEPTSGNLDVVGALATYADPADWPLDVSSVFTDFLDATTLELTFPSNPSSVGSYSNCFKLTVSKSGVTKTKYVSLNLYNYRF